MGRTNRSNTEIRLPLAGFRRHLGQVKRSAAAEASPRPEAGVARSVPSPDPTSPPATKARGR